MVTELPPEIPKRTPEVAIGHYYDPIRSSQFPVMAHDDISKRRRMLIEATDRCEPISLENAARFLECSPYGIRRLVKARLLPKPTQQTKNTLIFELEDWLNWFAEDEADRKLFLEQTKGNQKVVKDNPDIFGPLSGAQGKYSACKYQLGIWSNEKKDLARKRKTELRRAGVLKKKRRNTQSYLKIKSSAQRQEMMKAKPICSLSEAAIVLGCSVHAVLDRIQAGTLKTRMSAKGGMRVDLTNEIRKNEDAKGNAQATTMDRKAREFAVMKAQNARKDYLRSPERFAIVLRHQDPSSGSVGEPIDLKLEELDKAISDAMGMPDNPSEMMYQEEESAVEFEELLELQD
jgi:hypothetical protein